MMHRARVELQCLAVANAHNTFTKHRHEKVLAWAVMWAAAALKTGPVQRAVLRHAAPSFAQAHNKMESSKGLKLDKRDVAPATILLMMSSMLRFKIAKDHAVLLRAWTGTFPVSKVSKAVEIDRSKFWTTCSCCNKAWLLLLVVANFANLCSPVVKFTMFICGKW
eukprot:CAMPEP_0115313290 /NCGR_PEP_ID=MMETSP0270-20121206/76385_1 /TAXON_ID=71861 /ORGANISM="Scrippsiella trochoidea, Strain CCMP3099" /LENGTH=164 /DNA_ID=CAMNT_0002732369 /DNA_START=101 /DNA_END=595 /DNA_ORIENTATION=-